MSWKFLVGGTAKGLGQGMVTQAEQRRQDALEKARQMARQKEIEGNQQFQSQERAAGEEFRANLSAEERAAASAEREKDRQTRAGERKEDSALRERMSRTEFISEHVNDVAKNQAQAGIFPGDDQYVSPEEAEKQAAQIYQRYSKGGDEPANPRGADPEFMEGVVEMNRRPPKNFVEESSRNTNAPPPKASARGASKPPPAPTDPSQLKPKQEYTLPNGEVAEWTGSYFRMVR